jgi:hypothetical protein
MFAATRAKAAESLKRRQVRTLVYFHCDHFEPWRGFKGDVSPQNVDDILEVARALDQVDYARRLTLFYKCNNYICTTLDRLQLRADGDEIGFAVPTERETNIARIALEHLAHNTGHEIQVHYHHEFFTGNDKYCMSMPETRDFFRQRNTPELDRKRWEIGLSLALETIRLEAKIPLDRWFFVHGNWALNGSDTEVCTITDEIQRLQRLGCIGDFSFPAGRGHCDPRYPEPVFVRPVDALKGYDLTEAEAVPAYDNRAAADEKFFIWSSPIKANSSSIDYFSLDVRRRCEELDDWVEDIVERSVLKDGTLFVKTHAHSMHMDYFEAARRPIPPHLHPGVQNLFGVLFDGAADAGIAVEFATVSEVYRRFVDPAVTTLQTDTAEPPPLPQVFPKPPAVSAGTSDGIRDACAAVDRVALAVMRERVVAMGGEAAGTYAYYDALLTEGRLLQQFEINLAEYLIAELAPGQPVVDIRCGLGILVLVLAATGNTAYGVEGDLRRVESFAAIRDVVGETLPAAKANSAMLTGVFPDSLAAAPPREAVIVFADTVSGIELDEQRAIIAGAAGFAWVLFDAQRFFRKRTTSEEIGELLELFVNAGFEAPQLVLDWGERGQYYRAGGRRTGRDRAGPPELAVPSEPTVPSGPA